MYPQTELLILPTRCASYPLMRVTFSDGSVVVRFPWNFASPPRGRFLR